MDPLTFTFATPVTGFRNPAECALAAIKALKVPGIDEESFLRVAAEVGDMPPEVLADGFSVTSMEDVYRLCEIGEFVIDSSNGTIRCVGKG